MNAVELYWTLNFGCAIFVVGSYIRDINTIYPVRMGYPNTRLGWCQYFLQIHLASVFLTWISLPLLVVAGVVRLTRKVTTGRWTSC
jgi:hypothetical protein